MQGLSLITLLLRNFRSVFNKLGCLRTVWIPTLNFWCSELWIVTSLLFYWPIVILNLVLKYSRSIVKNQRQCTNVSWGLVCERATFRIWSLFLNKTFTWWCMKRWILVLKLIWSVKISCSITLCIRHNCWGVIFRSVVHGLAFFSF